VVQRSAAYPHLFSALLIFRHETGTAFCLLTRARGTGYLSAWTLPDIEDR
jgi:hypothetical protein